MTRSPQSTKPPQPTKLRQPTQPPVKIPGVAGPNLGGCDPRGCGEASAAFNAKVGAAMAQIITGLRDIGTAYGVCQIAVGSLCKTCCQTVSDVAVKKCQD